MIKLTLLNGGSVVFNRKHIVAIYPINAGSQIVTLAGSWSVKQTLKQLEEIFDWEVING